MSFPDLTVGDDLSAALVVKGARFGVAPDHHLHGFRTLLRHAARCGVLRTGLSSQQNQYDPEDPPSEQTFA